MKKLRLITSKTLVPGVISITDNKLKSGLFYITSEGKAINITEGNSKYRPIHCSELYNRLKSRDWNITERKYISKVSTEEGKELDALTVKVTPTNGEVDKIDTKNPQTGVIVCSINEPSEKEIESFRNEEAYKNILNKMDVNEIYLYNSSKGYVNLLDGSVSLDIIKLDSDIYTNSVNLNDIFTVTSTHDGNISFKVDISIQYSKSGKIFNKDLTFKGAEYLQEGLVRKNLVSDINNDIRFEYLNGVVKLFPLKDEVDEYIISNCTVTYGNIRKISWV